MDYKVVLASKSPRRQELLKQIVPNFAIRTKEVDETYPSELRGAQVVEYLAELKSSAFASDLATDELLITADTIVCVDGCVLGKPANRTDAIAMLQKLSGRAHHVYTGVCIKTTQKQRIFSVDTEVWFAQLTNDEILHYVDTYKPFDKAGAYGIQEWIGYIGIERINGSYFNVVGLPVQRLYAELKVF